MRYTIITNSTWDTYIIVGDYKATHQKPVAVDCGLQEQNFRRNSDVKPQIEIVRFITNSFCETT